MANSLAAVRAGAGMVQGTMNGYGERCGNANLVSIVPNLQLKMGHECLPELTGLTEASHLLDELLNFVPDPNRPYVGANAFAHKGGMHVAGVAADPATFEHIDPAAVGNAREVLISELSGKGTVLQRAEATGVELDAAAAARVVERVKQLEHEGFHFEAADGSFDLLIRRETGEYAAAVPARVLARDRGEARGRPGRRPRRRSRSGSTGERYVRTAEGNGPVTRSTRRCARRSRRPTRISATSGSSTTRSASSTSRRRPARSRACCSTRPTARTRGARSACRENVIEASWDALVDSLEAGHAARPRPPHARGATPTRVSTELDVIPLARPVIGEPEERAVLEVLRSGQLSLGPRVPAFEAAFAARVGRASTPAPSPRARPACTWRCARSAWRTGDEVVTSPFSFVASANAVLYEGARRCSPTSTR